MGGIDEEWLTHILEDTKGMEFVVLHKNKFLAVIGIILPNEKEKAYVITNIAVNPGYTNRGIGSKILKQFLQQFDLKQEEYWMAYVAELNKIAHQFFEENGWIRTGTEEGMIRYFLKEDI